MENMGIRKLTKELKRLNRGTTIYCNDETHPAIIIARCSDCSQLHLPNGYYCNDKNGLTNKHNTDSGMYECFELMTEYEYFEKLA